MEIARENSLIDYISGKHIKDGPEEREAIQVFSRILVEDYNYPKECITTRPQYRVKMRPSDTKKEYPVDIAVFSRKEKLDDQLLIIVECKKATRKDGSDQLKDYLRFSNAQIGVWFNGNERLFLKKTETKGKVLFEEIPGIPKHGERLEDIGLHKRKDLKPAHNLKSVFKTIRNYLAANAVGITRDEIFAQQVINLIFCKIYDERFTKAEDTVKFRAGIGEDLKIVRKRILEIFNHVKKQYNDVIDPTDEILLDDNALVYIIGELQIYSITNTERDAIADAFETFIGPSLKGAQGQFFSPRNVVKIIVDIINVSETEKVIDPACGSGGFLVEVLKSAWKKVEVQGKKYNWPDSEIQSEKQKVAIKNVRGIDKDYFLSKVAKAYMAIIGDGRGGVFCENSLDDYKSWKYQTKEHVQEETFDIVVTNPPFGSKLKIDDTHVLSLYSLGFKWKFDRSINSYIKTSELTDGQSPQILFIEKCLNLLKPGGRLGIIVPESMFCNPSHKYIVKYIKSIASIKAVISLPEELFQPHTHAKTCAVIIEKTPTTKNGHEIFMAVAKWCGHDSRGLEIPHDDIPKILEKYMEYRENGHLAYDHLGFIINDKNIIDDIYLPKYYNPEISNHLNELKNTHDLITIGNLIDQNVLNISTGHEVGKLAYGSGNIPYVRTSDIANWEIKIDFKHGLSEEIYQKLKHKQDIRENDILMVRDGTYLVGTSALITKDDIKIVFQSHIYKIRSNNHEILHPYLLIALLSCPIVKLQIYSKRFTQDIIDTLGGRIRELVLPVPKDVKYKDNIISQVSKIIELKNKAKELTKDVISEITPVMIAKDEQLDIS